MTAVPKPHWVWEAHVPYQWGTPDPARCAHRVYRSGSFLAKQCGMKHTTERHGFKVCTRHAHLIDKRPQ